MAVNQLGDGSTDGTVVCVSGSKAAFYGAAPVAIRATGVTHSTATVSLSTWLTVGSNLALWATEVTNTLLGLGIWV
jgi:hypothetical protein